MHAKNTAAIIGTRGRPPFRGSTPEEICLHHLQDPVPDPRNLAPGITQEITPILYRMMSKEREARYQSAGEIVRDLLRVRKDAGSDERTNLRRCSATDLPAPVDLPRWRVAIHAGGGSAAATGCWTQQALLRCIATL